MTGFSRLPKYHHMVRRARPLLAAGVALALTLAGCSSRDAPTDTSPSSGPTTAPPDDARPVVDLAFDVAEDLRSATGEETVTFTPDLAVCALVFRAWPNKPGTARTGNSLVVNAARVDGVDAVPRDLPAGAPSGRPGTLVEVPLSPCVDAGTEVTAELDFTLTLGPRTDERVGVAPDEEIAWFATAFPLLAWERGRGWATEPAVAVVGEMATSETFELRSLAVTAPSRYQVLGTGTADDATEDSGSDTTVHSFSAPAVRDVSVTVGDLDVIEREVDGVRLHVGGQAGGSREPLEAWADQTEESMRRLVELLGPFPYDDLWVSVLPGVTDGVEFTGAIQLGDAARVPPGLVSHEVAHMWFYGLVGNNQARDPWLDEAFSSYAQRIADGQETARQDERIAASVSGRVGRPMSFWAGYRDPSEAYVAGVYTAGGAALLEARRQGGEAAFDEAVRAYVGSSAHRVAVPSDLAAALAGLPESVEVLVAAGALPS